MNLTLYRSDKLFYRPKEAAIVLGMSRTAVFRLIKTGELQSVKRDGYRLIHVEALQEFARALVEASESSPERAA